MRTRGTIIPEPGQDAAQYGCWCVMELGRDPMEKELCQCKMINQNSSATVCPILVPPK